MTTQKTPRPADAQSCRKLLTMQDLSIRWGISLRSVLRMKDAGELPMHFRLGPKQIRFPLAAVEEFERTGEVQS